jgi:mannose-6-phosphate isomerase-like protein (cupin superfamily)
MAVELDVRQGVVLRPGEGEEVSTRPNRSVLIALDLDQLSATISSYGNTQGGARPHIHRRHADTFFVVDGELVFTTGTERVRAPAGTAFCAPPGLVHGFATVGAARFLNFHTPDAGFAESLRLRREGRPYDPADLDSFDPPAEGGPPASAAIVVGSCGGERLTRDSRQALVKIVREELALVEFTLDPGFEGPKPHLHRRHVDAFFVLEGEVEFRVGDETVTLGPGSCIAAPPGVVHSFGRPGPHGARLVNVHAPSSDFDEYLRVMDEAGGELDEATHARYDVDEVE